MQSIQSPTNWFFKKGQQPSETLEKETGKSIKQKRKETKKSMNT